MTTLLDIASKYRRSLQWITGILVTYSLAGFLLLPWLAEQQVKGLLQERLQLETDIESLYLNPFTFYTELEGLNIFEPDGSTLLSLENFNANLQFMRLLLLQVRLTDTSVSGMDLYLQRESETNNTLSTLAGRWQASQTTEVIESTETSEPGELFPLTVDRLQLSNLRAHITDRVPDEVFTSSVSLDTATITNLSTLMDSPGNLDMQISTDEGARLQTSATFHISPMRIEGDFSLNEFALAPFSTYVSSALPVSIDDGQLQLRFSYGVDLAGEELRLELAGIDVSLATLALSSTETNGRFLQLGELALERGSVRVPDNSSTISDIAISGLQITANRETDGSLDLLRLIPDPTDPEAQANTNEPAGSETRPWSIAIDQAQLIENQLTFTDRALRNAYTRTASLNLTVNDINNQPGSQFPLDLSLGLDSGGLATLQGDLTVLPAVAAEAELILEGLELNALAPLLAEYTTLNLQSGALSSTLTLIIDEDEPFATTGDIAIADLLLIDTVRAAPLLSLPTLQVDSLNYSIANNRAEVSELLLADLSIRVIINEDGSTNLGQSIRASESTSQETSVTEPDAETGSSSLPAITLGRISLQDAAMNFTDRDLPFEFNANVQDLNADINNISNTTSELTRVTLEGQVGEFGLMQLDTELDPFNFTNAATIDLRFSNIDLPGATPYAIKFAGREVDAGTIGLRLEYTLENQNLVANNRMTLNDLELGDEIDYPDAMDLPLDLAIALLKDSNGVIEFEVPVSGELNDPEFDLGPAIRRAIGNILTNIVAAPFRLLGSLVGAGADANIDQVRFLPGRADIAAPEQQKLLQLGEALTQRPELLLQIPLLQGGESDRFALQTAAVDSRIEDALANSADTERSLVERRTTALEALYSAINPGAALADIRTAHTTLPAATTADQSDASAASVENTALPQFDVIAYNNDLRDRLIAAEPIGEAELSVLASERLANVSEYLTTNALLSTARLVPDEAVTVEEDEEGWLVMEFGLGSK